MPSGIAKDHLALSELNSDSSWIEYILLIILSKSELFWFSFLRKCANFDYHQINSWHKQKFPQNHKKVKGELKDSLFCSLYLLLAALC